jgi:tetratricopeptide (TPR) repeat protein
MGQAYKKLGDVARARELWEEALRIFEEIEDPHAEWVRRWLGELEKG